MLQKSYFTLLVLLLSANLFAQKTKTIALVPTPIDLAGREFYIDSVVDNRIVKDNLGEAHVGMGNKAVPVVFATPFAAQMKTYFKTTTPQSKSGQIPLIAVINELHVYEKIYRTKERGVADLDIAFCKLDSGVLKIVAETVNTQESGGMDVTNAHDKRIDLAIRECLKQLQVAKWKENPGVTLVVGAEWKPTDDEHNLLKAKPWKYGSYKNFNDLRSNSPANADKMIVPPSEGNELVMIRSEATNKKLVEAYGFNDGKAIYINTFFYNGNKTKGVFAKVQVIGPYLGWVDHYQSDSERMGVQAAFGAIGNAVAASDEDAIVLNLRTGMITALNAERLMKLLENEPELLAEYQKTKTRDPNTQLSFIRRLNELHPDL